jgi:streptogramin lyase
MPAATIVQTNATAALPSVRGRVRFYPDTFGDATPAGITQGADGQVWFTDPGNDVIGRLTARGHYTLEMPAGVEVSDGITTGPDKNIWFTVEQGGGGVGRITDDGTVTIFKDPGGSYTQGITVGPDGALWFAESNGTVGRMTTAGKVKHFAVAPYDAELEGIVTGPDGNLWVTQYIVGGSRFSNAVIRLSTNGQFKAFTVGHGPYGSGPDAICAGSDRALWFTLADDNALGRLTTSGSFKEYPTNVEYAQPSGIAAGPDGALWFTDFSGIFGIGRMTTKGKATYYDYGGIPRTLEIAPGPDRNMWFTVDGFPPQIGRIATR